MKLRKLHIEDYKMFKDFDIDFVDERDNPLDVVVLAGVNGSGKTTIADNKYIRFLKKDEEGNIRAINDIQAYGRDIEWVLQQMGVEDIRLPKITKHFEEIQVFINNQEFDKADEALDKLEYVIGDNDKDILALRNDLAFERMDFEEDN